MMFTMLLTIEFTTCQRAQKAESEQEMLTLDFLGPLDLFVYLKKSNWCHTERKYGLISYAFFMK